MHIPPIAPKKPCSTVNISGELQDALSILSEPPSSETKTPDSTARLCSHEWDAWSVIAGIVLGALTVLGAMWLNSY